jgi:hypothetical protein
MTDSSSEQPQQRHEAGDVNVRSIVKLTMMLMGIVIALSFILFGLTVYFRNRQPMTFAQTEEQIQAQAPPPLPHLEEKPGVGLKKLRQEKEHLLHSYGWIDKKKKIIHIPIENAMRLLVMKETTGH